MRNRLAATIAAVAIIGAIVAPTAGAHAAQLVPRDVPGPCNDPTDGFNLIIGSAAGDQLVGTSCNDAIFGRRGNDVIRSGLGYDLDRGGRGNDRIVDTSFLVGGEIHGGRGIDTCVVVADTLVQLYSCEVVVEL